jgi:uncharacterized protein (TIGR02466 family)
MPEFFRVHNLWPIPVYEANLPVKEEWKTSIRNLKYVRTHIANSDISEDRFIFHKMPDLEKEIMKHCENYIRKYLMISDNATFYFQNSWSNIHKPNDYSQIHYHANALLSGVYYPILPKNSGDIVLCKPNMFCNLFPSAIKVNYDKIDNVNSDSFQLNLEEGSICIFPSQLEHSVQKNKSNEDRYSVAFNLYVKGKFGKEEYQLEIK